MYLGNEINYFKINYLKLDDIEIIANNEVYNKGDGFISVLIGENGVGKSNILSSIEGIFNEISIYLKERKTINLKYYAYYEMQYSINENIYQVIKSKSGIEFFINNEIIDLKNITSKPSGEVFKLPKSVLCCAFQVNDKFKFRKQQDELLKYLGVKTTPTMTNSSSVTKRVCNNILECIYNKNGNEKYLQLLIKIFDFLELDHDIYIEYKIKYKSIFFNAQNPVTKDNIVSKVEKELWKKRTKNSAFGKGMFEDIKHDNEILERLVFQIHQIFMLNLSKDKIKLNIKLDAENRYLHDYYNKEMIEILIKLDILSNPKVVINKRNYYDLENGSSGETHILFLMTNIITNIEKGSLILIDEPEISLHPSWQIRIIELIRYVMKESEKPCHVIIATHSHFIVSDIKPDNSSLHILKKDFSKNQLECENMCNDTYGWSAENILFNVFGVPTNRNYYLAKELDNLLTEVSMGNLEAVLSKKEELLNISERLLDADPLKVVIKKIISRTEEDYRK